MGLAPIHVEAQADAQADVQIREDGSLEVAWTRAEDRVLGAGEALQLTLSRDLVPGDGRLVLLVGDTDVSALVDRSGRHLVYRPSVEGLPRGDSEVRVILVQPGPDAGPWREVARLPLRVQVAPGVDRVELAPRVSVSSTGLWAEGPRDIGGPGGSGYGPVPDPLQALTGQFDLTSEITRGSRGVTLTASFSGVSQREDALRFREIQDEAPRFDLSRYQLGLDLPGSTLVQAGSVSAGSHSDLIRGFSARGVTVETAPAPGVTLNVAALQGSNRVGWDRLVGLGDPADRLLTARIGGDLLQGRPGRFQVEGHLLDGSRLATPSFGRGAIRDREASQGVAFRVQGASPGDRLRGDLSLARSRYDAPPDERVSPEVAALSRADQARNALRVETSLLLVRSMALPAGLTGTLRAVHRWGQVDPLYRTVGAFVRADARENALDLQSSAGPAVLRYTLDRSMDNLDEIPSILRTRTHRHTVDLSIPLRALPRRAPAPSEGTSGLGAPGLGAPRSAWLPTLTWRFNQVREFGTDVPLDGGFEPSHVPDQMNDAHNLGLAWQGTRVRGGMRGGWTFQDNRQPGRENDDFRNLTAGGSLGATLSPRVEVTADGSRESAQNRGRSQEEVTWSGTVGLTARPGWGVGLRTSVAPSRTRDVEGLRERSALSVNAELSRPLRIPLALRPGSGPRSSLGARDGSLVLRLTHRQSSRVDRVLELNDETRRWSLTSGLSLNFF